MPTFSCWTRCGPTSSLSTWTLRWLGLANRTGRSEAENGAPPQHGDAAIDNDAAPWRVRLERDAQSYGRALARLPLDLRMHANDSRRSAVQSLGPQFLPKFAFASAMQLALASPAMASHFSAATL